MHARVRRPADAAGFSLLELLVVVFIVGVLATMLTLSVGVVGGDRELETEIDRLIALIELAREEASLQGREIGMRFHDRGYEFAAYYEDFVEYHDEEHPDQSEWAPLDDASLLGPRRLPGDLQFELLMDGRAIVLKGEDEETSGQMPESEDEAAVTRYEPQIMIYSSGDMTPFEIEVRRSFANAGTSIEFDIDGSSAITAAER